MEERSDSSPPVSAQNAVFVPVEVVDETVAWPRPWGFWATMGWSAVVTVVYFVGNVAAVVGFLIVSEVFDLGFGFHTDTRSLQYNGLMLGIVTAVSVPMVLGPVWLFIRLRGMSAAEYLDLRGVSVRTWGFWLATTAALIVVGDLVTSLVDQDVVPPFMTDIWQTAGWLPLLLAALILFAPLTEEVFFRGFLFVGLWRSPVGAVGAVLFTSLTWAAIHTQYNLYQVTTIFILGIFLGIARIRSRSLYVTMALHALVNTVATIEAAWVMAQR